MKSAVWEENQKGFQGLSKAIGAVNSHVDKLFLATDGANRRQNV